MLDHRLAPGQLGRDQPVIGAEHHHRFGRPVPLEVGQHAGHALGRDGAVRQAELEEPSGKLLGVFGGGGHDQAPVSSRTAESLKRVRSASESSFSSTRRVTTTRRAISPRASASIFFFSSSIACWALAMRSLARSEAAFCSRSANSLAALRASSISLVASTWACLITAALSCWACSSLAFISSAYFRPESIFFWRSSSVAMTGLKAKRQRMKATMLKLIIWAMRPDQLTPRPFSS